MGFNYPLILALSTVFLNTMLIVNAGTAAATTFTLQFPDELSSGNECCKNFHMDSSGFCIFNAYSLTRLQERYTFCHPKEADGKKRNWESEAEYCLHLQAANINK